MNRNQIMCFAFLVMAQAAHAMEEEPSEKIKIGVVKTSLSAHLVQAIVYGGLLNNMDIYRYEEGELINEGKLGKLAEERKWEIREVVESKNYVYIAKEGMRGPSLTLGSNDKDVVKKFLVPSESLEKKPSLRRILSFGKKRKPTGGEQVIKVINPLYIEKNSSENQKEEDK